MVKCYHVFRAPETASPGIIVRSLEIGQQGNTFSNYNSIILLFKLIGINDKIIIHLTGGLIAQAF